MSALEELLSELGKVCAGLEDKRRGQGYLYTMADIGLARIIHEGGRRIRRAVGVAQALERT